MFVTHLLFHYYFYMKCNLKYNFRFNRADVDRPMNLIRHQWIGIGLAELDFDCAVIEQFRHCLFELG